MNTKWFLELHLVFHDYITKTTLHSCSSIKICAWLNRIIILAVKYSEIDCFTMIVLPLQTVARNDLEALMVPFCGTVIALSVVLNNEKRL